MKLKYLINIFLKEAKGIFTLFIHQNYYLILLYPLKFFFKKKKIKLQNKIYIYVNNNNFREIDLYNYLKNKFEIVLIYKKKPKYSSILENHTAIIEEKNFFISLVSNPYKKILHVSETSEIFPFLLFDKNIIFSIYDMVKGYNKGLLREYFEKISVKNIKFAIYRDPRIKKNFNKFHKNIKSILILEDTYNFKKSKKLKKIHAVSLGSIDQNICSIKKTIDLLCKNKITVHIFSNQKNIIENIKYLKHQKKKYKKFLVIEKPLYGLKLLKKISKYHIGISPHENYDNFKNLNHLKCYYENCGSARIVSYLSSNLINLLSKKLKFQISMIKAYGGKLIYYEDFFNDSDDNFNYKKNIYNFNKNNNLKKNYYNFNFKSKKIINFLNQISN